MKRQTIHINDDLLIRYLAEEATVEEIQVIETWSAESDAHKRKLDAYRVLFEESRTLKPSIFGNADKAWERFEQHIDSEDPFVNETHPYRKWLAIAASLLILIAGIWLYNNQPQTVSLSALDEPLADSLADGSLVALNSNSSLTFTAGKTRAATLTGEAFFSIKQDASHPFHIKVNDVLINVLGTSFNVRTIDGKTEVLVGTGSVSVSGEGQNTLLKGGEKMLTTPGQRWQKQAQRGFNISDYPGLAYAMSKDPKNWTPVLRNFTANMDSVSQAATNKALIHAIIARLVGDGIAEQRSVRTFRLSGTEFLINGLPQSDAVFRRYKALYLPSDDFTIALGDEYTGNKGIFVPRKGF